PAVGGPRPAVPLGGLQRDEHGALRPAVAEPLDHGRPHFRPLHRNALAASGDAVRAAVRILIVVVRSPWSVVRSLAGVIGSDERTDHGLRATDYGPRSFSDRIKPLSIMPTRAAFSRRSASRSASM